ncbi:MAG: transposase [Phycisphaerae bacterium]|nr:transposase [Phycisphaerae bacterium]
MTQKRRRFTAEFKSRVVRAALRENKTLAQLASEFDVHPNQITEWKRQTLEALQQALSSGRQPETFNTDHGGLFTSEAFTGLLTKHGIAISMDGVGHAFDNIMVERLWRTVKYEDVYIRDYKKPAEARFGLRRYFEHYNRRRRHRSLGRKTPAAVYGLAKGRDFDRMKTDGGRSAVATALGSVPLHKSRLNVSPCETVPP